MKHNFVAKNLFTFNKPKKHKETQDRTKYCRKRDKKVDINKTV